MKDVIVDSKQIPLLFISSLTALFFKFPKMLLLFSSDIPSLGRADKEMLTSQQRMEMLLVTEDGSSPFDTKQSIIDDACTWPGVSCSSEGEVTQIEWSDPDRKLSGSINFGMLPRYLLTIGFVSQDFVGEVDTSDLPSNLTQLKVIVCEFTGTLNLGHLPRTLEIFTFVENRITRIENMVNLPISLQSFTIDERFIEQDDLIIGTLPQNTFVISVQIPNTPNIRWECPNDRCRTIVSTGDYEDYW